MFVAQPQHENRKHTKHLHVKQAKNVHVECLTRITAFSTPLRALTESNKDMYPTPSPGSPRVDDSRKDRRRKKGKTVTLFRVFVRVVQKQSRGVLFVFPFFVQKDKHTWGKKKAETAGRRHAQNPTRRSPRRILLSHHQNVLLTRSQQLFVRKQRLDFAQRLHRSASGRGSLGGWLCRKPTSVPCCWRRRDRPHWW